MKISHRIILTTLAFLSLACTTPAADKPITDARPRHQFGREENLHEGRGFGGEHMGGMREHGRESMLARFVTNKEVAKKLDLSEEQVNHLKAKSIELRKASIQLNAKRELAGLEQVELLSADTIDEEALMAAVEKTGRIQTEFAKLKIKQLIMIKQTLTPEQLDRAKEMLHDRMRQHMRKKISGDKKHRERERNERREKPRKDREDKE
ncbi:MAG: hypothetical protein ISS35_00655 [Kiritimatiellae bacterium]|nr:hypothetical protein [Kiritimatiellia bacterium]